MDPSTRSCPLHCGQSPEWSACPPQRPELAHSPGRPTPSAWTPSGSYIDIYMYMYTITCNEHAQRFLHTCTCMCTCTPTRTHVYTCTWKSGQTSQWSLNSCCELVNPHRQGICTTRPKHMYMYSVHVQTYIVHKETCTCTYRCDGVRRCYKETHLLVQDTSRTCLKCRWLGDRSECPCAECITQESGWV